MTTAYDLAERFIGYQEIGGSKHAPFIQWCFSLCGYGPETPDETPWCSAFVNGVVWLLKLPRSKSAAARSWLQVGSPLDHREAQVGFDVVVLKRGQGAQPGPEVFNAPGHVGFFAGWDSAGRVLILGGNQGDEVSILPFPLQQVLGIRRLA